MSGINSNVVAIQNLLLEYTNYLNDTPNVTTADYQNAVRVLSTVFDTIVVSPDSGSLTALWNFFLINQTGILQEYIALQGIGVLSPIERFQFTMIYSLFRQATGGLTLPAANMMVGVALECPVLVQFLQAQALTITPTSNPSANFTTTSIAGLSGPLTATQVLSALQTSATVTASGTSQATATQLTAYTSVATSVPVGSGLMLSLLPEQVIYNRDVNTVLLYPQWETQVETLGAGLPVSIVPGGDATFSLVAGIYYTKP